MSDLGFDGMVKASFVSTIANLSAPTVSELTAGVPLEDHLLPDGLATPSDTADIDTSKLSSTFNTGIVGRRTFSGLMVKYVRGDDAGAIDVEEALVYKAKGYLVVRRDIDADIAWAAAQKVEIYPVQCKQPNPDNPGPDTRQAVEIKFAMTGDPKAFADTATVAA
jgi:hypothetical protein